MRSAAAAPPAAPPAAPAITGSQDPAPQAAVSSGCLIRNSDCDGCLYATQVSMPESKQEEQPADSLSIAGFDGENDNDQQSQSSPPSQSPLGPARPLDSARAPTRRALSLGPSPPPHSAVNRGPPGSAASCPASIAGEEPVPLIEQRLNLHLTPPKKKRRRSTDPRHVAPEKAVYEPGMILTAFGKDIAKKRKRLREARASQRASEKRRAVVAASEEKAGIVDTEVKAADATMTRDPYFIVLKLFTKVVRWTRFDHQIFTVSLRSDKAILLSAVRAGVGL
jgi:hypothetical protein